MGKCSNVKKEDGEGVLLIWRREQSAYSQSYKVINMADGRIYRTRRRTQNTCTRQGDGDCVFHLELEPNRGGELNTEEKAHIFDCVGVASAKSG
jgi:hypothetical protein